MAQYADNRLAQPVQLPAGGGTARHDFGHAWEQRAQRVQFALDIQALCFAGRAAVIALEWLDLVAAIDGNNDPLLGQRGAEQL